MDNYAFEAQFTAVKPLGLTPLGLRLDIEFAGLVTDGPLAGKALTGTDYLLIRPDGIGQIDVREVIRDGEVVLATLRVTGYIVQRFRCRRSMSWPAPVSNGPTSISRSTGRRSSKPPMRTSPPRRVRLRLERNGERPHRGLERFRRIHHAAPADLPATLAARP